MEKDDLIDDVKFVFRNFEDVNIEWITHLLEYGHRLENYFSEEYLEKLTIFLQMRKSIRDYQLMLRHHSEVLYEHFDAKMLKESLLKIKLKLPSKAFQKLLNSLEEEGAISAASIKNLKSYTTENKNDITHTELFYPSARQKESDRLLKLKIKDVKILKFFLKEGEDFEPGKHYNVRFRSSNEILKIVQRKSDTPLNSLRIFLRECNIMAEFSSPFILKILGYTMEPVKLLIIENVKSRSLKQFMGDKDNCKWEKLSKIIMGILMGLKLLHEKNILFRILDPHNILIDKGHIPKLCHFASVKKPKKNKIVKKVKINKYKAPELFHYGEFSKESDIWSLGQILSKILKHFESNIPLNVQSALIQIKRDCKTEDPGCRPKINDIIGKFLFAFHKLDGPCIGPPEERAEEDLPNNIFNLKSLKELRKTLPKNCFEHLVYSFIVAVKESKKYGINIANQEDYFLNLEKKGEIEEIKNYKEKLSDLRKISGKHHEQEIIRFFEKHYIINIPFTLNFIKKINSNINNDLGIVFIGDVRAKSSVINYILGSCFRINNGSAELVQQHERLFEWFIAHRLNAPRAYEVNRMKLKIDEQYGDKIFLIDSGGFETNDEVASTTKLLNNLNIINIMDRENMYRLVMVFENTDGKDVNFESPVKTIRAFASMLKKGFSGIENSLTFVFSGWRKERIEEFIAYLNFQNFENEDAESQQFLKNIFRSISEKKISLDFLDETKRADLLKDILKSSEKGIMKGLFGIPQEILNYIFCEWTSIENHLENSLKIRRYDIYIYEISLLEEFVYQVNEESLTVKLAKVIEKSQNFFQKELLDNLNSLEDKDFDKNNITKLDQCHKDLRACEKLGIFKILKVDYIKLFQAGLMSYLRDSCRKGDHDALKKLNLLSDSFYFIYELVYKETISIYKKKVKEISTEIEIQLNLLSLKEVKAEYESLNDLIPKFEILGIPVKIINDNFLQINNLIKLKLVSLIEEFNKEMADIVTSNSAEAIESLLKLLGIFLKAKTLSNKLCFIEYFGDNFPQLIEEKDGNPEPLSKVFNDTLNSGSLLKGIIIGLESKVESNLDEILSEIRNYSLNQEKEFKLLLEIEDLSKCLSEKTIKYKTLKEDIKYYSFKLLQKWVQDINEITKVNDLVEFETNEAFFFNFDFDVRKYKSSTLTDQKKIIDHLRAKNVLVNIDLFEKSRFWFNQFAIDVRNTLLIFLEAYFKQREMVISCYLNELILTLDSQGSIEFLTLLGDRTRQIEQILEEITALTIEFKPGPNTYAITRYLNHLFIVLRFSLDNKIKATSFKNKKDYLESISLLSELDTYFNFPRTKINFKKKCETLIFEEIERYYIKGCEQIIPKENCFTIDDIAEYLNEKLRQTGSDSITSRFCEQVGFTLFQKSLLLQSDLIIQFVKLLDLPKEVQMKEIATIFMEMNRLRDTSDDIKGLKYLTVPFRILYTIREKPQMKILDTQNCSSPEEKLETGKNYKTPLSYNPSELSKFKDNLEKNSAGKTIEMTRENNFEELLTRKDANEGNLENSDEGLVDDLVLVAEPGPLNY